VKPLTRYVCFQVPGWALAAALLLWLWPATGRASWIAVMLFLGWVAKDFVMYPLLRQAYQSDAATGASRLIGSEAVVVSALSPEGYVTVNGERWRALAAHAGASIPVGTRVRVDCADGLTLLVRPLA